MQTSVLRFAWELARRDFIDRFAGSILGFFWTFIWPLVNLSIYMIVFGKLMGARIGAYGGGPFSYGIYLTSGLIPWMLFANVTTRAATLFLDRASMISKVPVKLWALPLYLIISETIPFLITMFLLIAVFFSLGYGSPAKLLYMPVLYYLEVVFAYGLGLVLATLTVFLRDLKELTGIVLQLWFWFTPIVYTFDILPNVVKKLMVINPFLPIIKGFHNIFMDGGHIFTISLVVFALSVHLLFFAALWLHHKLEKDIRDFI